MEHKSDYPEAYGRLAALFDCMESGIIDAAYAIKRYKEIDAEHQKRMIAAYNGIPEDAIADMDDLYDHSKRELPTPDEADEMECYEQARRKSLSNPKNS